VGMTVDAAVAIVGDRGLVRGQTTARETEASPPGTVVDQSPSAGMSARRGSAVDLTVAAVPMVAVPDLAGLPLGEAKAQLNSSGLKFGATSVTGLFAGDESAAPKVRSQSPRARSRVARGTAVQLGLVHPGVEVPDLIKGTLAQARDRLGKAGLSAGDVEEQVVAGVPPGTVFEQGRPAGSLVARGSKINLRIAGKPLAATMPRIVGLHWSKATEILRAAGLTNFKTQGRLTKDVPHWQVLSQSPEAGTSVSPETRIEVVYAQQERALPVDPPPRSKDDAAKICPAVCAEQKMKWKAWFAEKPMYCYCTL